MRPIDGAELALWLQKQFRPQISADVARYVAEFDQFRESLDADSQAVRGAYLDLPKHLQHQWELLAPSEIKAGKHATFPVQVMSDIGPVVIGTYRALVGTGRRIRLAEDAIEWIPSFQRGVPTPRRPDDARKVRPQESGESLGGLVGMLVTLAESIDERAEEALEALEVDLDNYGYADRRGSVSREMPVHRSVRGEVNRRAGEAAIAAIPKLSTPWSVTGPSEAAVDADKVYAWLKNAREPKWLTGLDKADQDSIWEAIRQKGHVLYKAFAVQWEKGHTIRPLPENFWNFIAFWVTTNQPNINARCEKYNKIINLDEYGVCKDTTCALHPTRNRGTLNRNACNYQCITVRRN